MADPSNSYDSNSFGGTPSTSDPNDLSSPWNFDWLNPYGNFIAGLPDQMPGPLSLQRINGPREFYTDPQGYFAMRDASNGLAGFGSDMTSEIGPPSDGWDTPIGDVSRGATAFGGDAMSGGSGGNDLAGDAATDPAATRAHEFDLPYTPAGSLLAGDPAHIGAVAPAPAPVGSFVLGDPNASFSNEGAAGAAPTDDSDAPVLGANPAGSLLPLDPAHKGAVVGARPSPVQSSVAVNGMVPNITGYVTGLDVPEETASVKAALEAGLGQDDGTRVALLSHAMGIPIENFAIDHNGDYVFWDGTRWASAFLSPKNEGTQLSRYGTTTPLGPDRSSNPYFANALDTAQNQQMGYLATRYAPLAIGGVAGRAVGAALGLSGPLGWAVGTTVGAGTGAAVSAFEQEMANLILQRDPSNINMSQIAWEAAKNLAGSGLDFATGKIGEGLGKSLWRR